MKKVMTTLCAVSSAAAMCSHEPLISPDRLTFFNILPHQQYSDAKTHAKNMIEYEKKTGNSIVLFTVFISPIGENFRERVQDYVKYFKEFQQEVLRPASSVWFPLAARV